MLRGTEHPVLSWVGILTVPCQGVIQGGGGGGRRDFPPPKKIPPPLDSDQIYFNFVLN